MKETIFALASGRGKAGIAVIRVSGSLARDAMTALMGRPPAEAGRAEVARFRHPASGEALDRGLAVFFAGPRSFTGEDVAEFHVHGGPAVLAAMTGALSDLPGVRVAEPGEFSRRAFEHGKLDLTEAEGILDLVNAETEAQRTQALRQLEGALGALYEGWRSGVLDALAAIEAVIDFPDEETPEAVPPGVWAGVREIEAAMSAHLADGRRGERVREGFRIAIVGAPNAGKSSLLNALARRDAAIVSDIPGTTRDAIEVRLDLGGFLVTVIDTAGLRESLDPIEREGVRRAEAAAAGADLVLEVVDARTGSGAREGWPGKVWRLWNKMDLVEGGPAEGTIGVSAKTGAGLDALGDKLRMRVAEEGRGGETPLTRERHRRAVWEARDALRRALDRREGALELAAEDVRLAARALGRITGRVDVEDVLDRLFAEFCIGK